MIRFFKYLFFIILKRDKCLIVQLSIATHLSTNSLLACNQFSFLDEQMNRCVFRYKSMDETGKKRWNGWTIKRACHRFLPIDRCNRYQSNQIYRFLLTYRLINGYWFLPIDYSGLYPKMNLNIYVTLKFESMTLSFFAMSNGKNVFFKRTCSIWLVDSHLRLIKNHWSFVEQRPYQILLTFSCRRKSYSVLFEYWLIFRSLE